MKRAMNRPQLPTPNSQLPTPRAKRAMIQALLGRKLGMTRLFDENGVVTASTLVEAGPCFITQLRTPENDGYTAVQLGFGEKPRSTKPHKGHLKKAGLTDKEGLEAMR